MRKLISHRFRAALALAMFLPGAAMAQGMFAPAIIVNDKVITGYELGQRALMLKTLRAPGDPEQVAREQLINDRLRMQAAQEAGIVPTQQDVQDGMDEFASRANMDRAQFLRALASDGIAEQTFRDFVAAGVAWRGVVQQRFSGRANVTEAEVDRALSNAGGGAGGVRVLLSEIIMPMSGSDEAAVRARAARIAEIDSLSAFSAQARQYSASASRGAGGRLPWRDLNELPAPLRPIILGLRPGEVSDPLPLQGAIALFQLRDIEEVGYEAPEVAALDYAIYAMPGGRGEKALARARVLKARVDLCDDLYGAAKGQPEGVLERVVLPPAQIPTDIAFELSKLDPGEVSTALTRADGQTLVFLMLCGRTNTVVEGADREGVTVGLRNQRMGALADGYLAQLRANARIIER